MTIQNGVPEVCPVCDRDDMQFWTVREASEKLRVDKRDIYRLIQEGTLWHIHLSERRLRLSVGKLREQLNDPDNFKEQDCPICNGRDIPEDIRKKMKRAVHGIQ